MAFFGRRPKKPQSVPGAASGGREADVSARVRGAFERATRGRQERSVRAIRFTRNERKGR